jgi:hypothetical protein
VSVVGGWTSLPEARGTAPVVAGSVTALSGRHELTAWAGTEVVVRARSDSPVPGRARLVGVAEERTGAVHWGPWTVDLATGRPRRLDALAAADDDPFVPVAPGRARGGSAAAAYAWSADGTTVAVSVRHRAGPRAGSAEVVLRDRSGDRAGTVWQASGPAPSAVWVGRRVVVVGDRNPLVRMHDGTAVADLEAVTPPVRMEADEDETRLLVVEHGCLSVWDTSRWEAVATAEAPWLDAAMGPTGAEVAALDLAGRLHVLDGRLRSVAVVDTPAGASATGVALGRDRVVVSGATGTGSARLDRH